LGQPISKPFPEAFGLQAASVNNCLRILAGNEISPGSEREVLSLVSEGCSNKQGALRMNTSPRTFESHRAEAMRKLGARNTADLVRKALLQPD
jgi:DNA-binding CsgD family transcriptional regulator